MKASADRSTIVATMQRHSCERPDAVAFRFLGRHPHQTRELSWRELQESAVRLASVFGGRSLMGVPIAIICPDPCDFVVAIAGCFLASAPAVPVPAVATRRSAERIKSIVEASAPSAIVARAATLAQPWIAALIDPGTVDAVALDQEPREDQTESEDLPEPSSPALMQFTSGS